jgi:hypothetical protein
LFRTDPINDLARSGVTPFCPALIVKLGLAYVWNYQIGCGTVFAINTAGN